VFLVVVPALLWWAGRRVIRKSHEYAPVPPLQFGVVLLPAVLPVIMYTYRPMGENRKLRVRPAVVTLIAEFRKDLAAGTRPQNLDGLRRQYQAAWRARTSDTAWRFTDPSRPLLRVPTTRAVPVQGKRWNVIYIQLETFRGWDTGFLRPDLKQSPTPYLDSLAHAGESAYWVRHLSMGPPTVSGFVSGLCSIKPHSFYTITTSFTYTALECLPAVLRRHGYTAEYYTGFDPDWDGETIWLQRWFDNYQLFKGGGDRAMFQRAARRIRQLGGADRPFMVMIASASNHYPFRNKEPRYHSPVGSPPAEAIRYTMRYTDDALREFVDSLRTEPWFDHTLLVITGDHGYNLGEHVTSGLLSGWRESVLVPLVIHGAHPRLRFGRHEEIVSLLDVAPTVADLVGIRDPNPWMGASLLSVDRGGAFTMIHGTAVYGDEGPFSMVVDPTDGAARLYDVRRDPLQRRDIAAIHEPVVLELRRQAERERELTDYVLEANRVWPDSLVSGVSPRARPAK
jgi:phosphoglycerol transferase MdoB-like AlkP superfamily enzyme